jgi:hypothetical protein
MANDIFIKAPLTDADFGPEPDAPYCYACDKTGHESDENDHCLKEREESDPMTVAKEYDL